MEMRKKGIFFFLDATIGAGIVILGLVLLSIMYISEQPTTNLNIMGEDILDTLESITVSEFKTYDAELITKLVNNGNITNENNSLLLQIGELWSENKIDLAKEFTKNVTDAIIPRHLGFSLLIDGEVIYERTYPEEKNFLLVSKKIVSGLSKYTPLRGFISKLRLNTVNYKKGSSLIYYGGFVGQGNITTTIRDMPLESNVTSMIMELSAVSNFTLKINEQFCGNFSPAAGYLRADRWNIINCNSSLIGGAVNNFTISFPTGLFNESFIGGGFILVRYNTQNIAYGEVPGKRTQYLPGINGPMNIFSSMEVPGTLTGMNIHIHYYNPFDWNFNIGNTTVYNESSPGEIHVYLNNTYLNSTLDYSFLSNKTVPIRLGIPNATYTGLANGLEAIIVNDVSGSMAYTDYDNPNSIWIQNNESLCFSGWVPDNRANPSRINFAINASKVFVDIILGASSQNRLGIVDFSGSKTVYSLYRDLIMTDGLYISSPNGCSPKRYNVNWMEPEFDDSDWTNISTAESGACGLQYMRFYRKHFNVNLIDFRRLRLRVEGDDGVLCYLNGNQVLYEENSVNTYDEVEMPLDTLVVGENVLACAIRDSGDGCDFNAQLYTEFESAGGTGMIDWSESDWRRLQMLNCGGSTTDPKYMVINENFDTDINLYATIFNPGGSISGEINISFYNSSVSDENLLGKIHFYEMDGWSYKTVRFNVSQAISTDTNYYSVIEYNNPNDRALNNQDFVTLYVSEPTIPDLVLDDLSFEPRFCTYGPLTTTLNATFSNMGNFTLDEFNVTFEYYNESITGWIEYGKVSFNGIGKGESLEALLPITINILNSTRIRAYIDKESKVPEKYSYNNIYEIIMEEEGPDVSILGMVINPDQHLCSGGAYDFNISVNVTAKYCDISTPFNVTFFYNDGGYDYINLPPITYTQMINGLVKDEVITVNQSYSEVLSVGFSYEYGIFVDYPPPYPGSLNEPYEENNIQYITLSSGTDLQIKVINVTPKNNTPSQTTEYLINASIENTYCNTNNFNVSFYNYTKVVGETVKTQIYREQITMAIGEVKNYSFTWNSAFDNATYIQVVADPENRILELSKDNNYNQKLISICGDNVCDGLETKANCAVDCTVCGDYVCDSGEDNSNCQIDCPSCGDSVCGWNETIANCGVDCDVNSSGLVLLMYLNDTYASGTFRDYSGLGNDGTAYNFESNPGYDYEYAGKFDTCIEIESNDYIRVPDDDSIGNSGLSELTFSVWLYSDSESNYYEVMGTSNNWNGNGFSLYTRDSTNNDLAFTIDGNYIRAGEINTGEWYHVAGTYDGTTMRLYYNGVQIGFSTGKSGNINANSANGLYIGNIYGMSSNQFSGRIDELIIWDRALDEDEIWNLYDRSDRYLQLDISETFNFYEYLEMIPAAAALEGVSESSCSAWYSPGSTTMWTDGVVREQSLTDNIGVLKAHIDDTELIQGTCTCCGINRAVELLKASPFSSTKSILLMSDGEPTVECTGMGSIPNHPEGWGTDEDQAIEAACRAYDNYNITVHAICASCGAHAQDVMEAIATCGHGNYSSVSDMADLEDAYESVAKNMLNASYFWQSIAKADYTNITLYPDSYIEINYTPSTVQPETGDISVTLETKKFQNCTPTVQLPNKENFIVQDARILSYSDQHWTSYLNVNNHEIFNLTNFNRRYLDLGDPFVMYVPGKYLDHTTGVNDIVIYTADSPENFTNCSTNNSMIYNAFVKSSFNSELGNVANGCNWTIEFDDGSIENNYFPPYYAGDKHCSFTSTLVSYDINDSIDLAIFELLDLIDFNDDNISDVSFDETGLNVDSILYNDVPSMWGPAVIEVYVWN